MTDVQRKHKFQGANPKELHKKYQLVAVNHHTTEPKALRLPCLTTSALIRSPHWTYTHYFGNKSTWKEVISIEGHICQWLYFLQPSFSQEEKKLIITPLNHYPPFFWVYTLARSTGLPALLSGMFIILSFTPASCQPAEIKTSIHTGGRERRSHSQVSCGHWKSQARWGSFQSSDPHP